MRKKARYHGPENGPPNKGASEGLTMLLDMLPDKLIFEFLNGTALSMVCKGLKERVKRTGGWIVDPRHFMKNNDRWTRFVYDVSGARAVDDDSKHEHVLGIHRSVAKSFAVNGDVGALNILRNRMRVMRISWSLVVPGVARTAAANDQPEVLEWAKVRPTTDMVDAASIAGAINSCEYMLRKCRQDERCYFISRILMRQTPETIIQLEKRRGARFDVLHPHVYDTIENGNMKTALWFAMSGRCSWDWVLKYIMTFSCKRNENLDNVKLALSEGCPFSDNDFPSTLNLKDTDSEARLIAEFSKEFGRVPSVQFMTDCISRGYTKILQALHERAGVFPSNLAFRRAFGDMHLKTIEWVCSTGRCLNPRVCANPMLDGILVRDDLTAFDWLYKTDFFYECTNMVDKAICFGARNIAEHLMSNGFTPDGSKVLEIMESQDGYARSYAATWAFENIPTSDTDYTSIFACMRATKSSRHYWDRTRTKYSAPENVYKMILSYFDHANRTMSMDDIVRVCDELGVDHSNAKRYRSRKLALLRKLFGLV